MRYVWFVDIYEEFMLYISQGSKFISDINRWKGVISKDNDLIYLNCNHVIFVGNLWRRSYVRIKWKKKFNYKKCKTQYEFLSSVLCQFAIFKEKIQTHTFPNCNNYFDSHVLMFKNSLQGPEGILPVNKKVSYMK